MTTGGQSLRLYKLQHNGSLARSFQHLCIFFFLSVSGSCVTHPYLVWLRWLDQLDKWVGPGLSGALMTLQMSCNWISIRDGLNPSKSKWPAASSTSETVRSTGKTCSIHRDDALYKMYCIVFNVLTIVQDMPLLWLGLRSQMSRPFWSTPILWLCKT